MCFLLLLCDEALLNSVPYFFLNKNISGDHADDGDELCFLIVSGFCYKCSKLPARSAVRLDILNIDYGIIKHSKWKVVIVLSII